MQEEPKQETRVGKKLSAGCLECVEINGRMRHDAFSPNFCKTKTSAGRQIEMTHTHTHEKHSKGFTVAALLCSGHDNPPCNHPRFGPEL